MFTIPRSITDKMEVLEGFRIIFIKCDPKSVIYKVSSKMAKSPAQAYPILPRGIAFALIVDTL